jgi:glycosyltransferase involved in cell wall biosynthesis
LKADKNLNVLLLINTLERAGAEKVVVNLARRLDHSRFNVSVATIWPGGDLTEDVMAAGIELNHLCNAGETAARALLPLRRLLRRKRVDILHSQLGVAALVARLAALICRSVGTVYTEQNVVGGYSRLGRFLNCATLWLPDVVVGSSQGVLDSWNLCRHRGARSSAVIPNGIDIPPWPGPKEGRQHWRKVFSASDDDLVIGTIGYCYERKGQRFLVQACQDLIRNRRVRLVIVGDGPLRRELEHLTEASGLGDRVTFTGAQADVSGLISSFDIFALPSVAEGMPIVLLEAMARGLPSVATTVGANSDVIRDRQSGILVPPKAVGELSKALESLVSSPDLRAQLGVAARQRIVAEFSVERMTRDYEAVYQRVASFRRLGAG